VFANVDDLGGCVCVCVCVSKTMLDRGGCVCKKVKCFARTSLMDDPLGLVFLLLLLLRLISI